MKNGIEDLRNHLFAALEGLADKQEPMEIERAKAISEVAKTLIDSAKVEVELLKVTGGESDSSLFKKKPAGPALPKPQALGKTGT